MIALRFLLIGIVLLNCLSSFYAAPSCLDSVDQQSRQCILGDLVLLLNEVVKRCAQNFQEQKQQSFASPTTQLPTATFEPTTTRDSVLTETQETTSAASYEITTRLLATTEGDFVVITSTVSDEEGTSTSETVGALQTVTATFLPELETTTAAFSTTSETEGALPTVTATLSPKLETTTAAPTTTIIDFESGTDETTTMTTPVDEKSSVTPAVSELSTVLDLTTSTSASLGTTSESAKLLNDPITTEAALIKTTTIDDSTVAATTTTESSLITTTATVDDPTTTKGSSLIADDPATTEAISSIATTTIDDSTTTEASSLIADVPSTTEAISSTATTTIDDSTTTEASSLIADDPATTEAIPSIATTTIDDSTTTEAGSVTTSAVASDTVAKEDSAINSDITTESLRTIGSPATIEESSAAEDADPDLLFSLDDQNSGERIDLL